MSRPGPVRYNDWRGLKECAAACTPARGVSVVVPCFQAPAALALTLAGLERQDWPRELLEVVVVDDGSEPPVARPADTPLDLKVIRQARDGFGLARARNAGARVATHDILVFLDADVIAEAGLVRAHARWHHAVADALTIGFCNSVSATGLDARAVRERTGSVAALLAGRAFDPPWNVRHMARTGDLTSRHGDLFRAVTGNNFAISRALFEEAGGFDASFDRYGGEDTEFAWRAQLQGALLVPAHEALGWHQGRWAEGRAAKRRDQASQAEKLARLIADPGFRRAGAQAPGAVPRHVVTLDAGAAPVASAVRAARALLDGPEADLAVCIAAPAPDVREALARHFAGEPRVRVPDAAPETAGALAAALGAFPASPLHLAVPVDAVLGWGAGAARSTVRLAAALGDAAEARGMLAGKQVTVAPAWALNRARRAGGRACDHGETCVLPTRLLRAGRGNILRRPRSAHRAPGGPATVLARILAEARHVRGLRTGWRFVRWLVAAARWRLAESRPWAPTPAAGPAVAAADPALEVRIAALGPRARRTFAASTRIRHAPGEAPVDVALADTVAAAAGIGAPVALVSEAPALAVPAFDPARDNPTGWVRDVEPRALALGPPALLPPGACARRDLTPGDSAALAHCHHVEDVAAFHADAFERAGTLARIAARGIPVHLADCDPDLAGLLGAELHAAMRADIRGADAAARERLSIAQRRAALRTHSLRARARQLCEAAGVEPPPHSRVSVLLATRRPALLAHAVASVARQRYPSVELVLALHGPGFAPHAVEAALARFAHPVTVLRLDAGLSLGAVLAAASAAASGELLAKMDDDDVYGPEHLWDLALAHEYSGAALVGKFPATVYLARSDRTVRQRGVASETRSRSITGGAMLVSRAGLARAGGWRDLARHVDEALADDVLRAGDGLYRTHDAGYLLVRHGERHTWERDDAAFLAGAEAVSEGWAPELAGLDGARRPPAPGAERGVGR